MTDVLITEPLVRRRLRHAQPKGVLLLNDNPWLLVQNIRGVIFPWSLGYKIWWALTAAGAIWTVFWEPFQIAFLQTQQGTMVELVMTILYSVDILLNFRLAFYRNALIVFELEEIATNYRKRMLWIDLLGVIPFQAITLLIIQNPNDSVLLYLSLLRLAKLARAHRLKPLSDRLQYSARVSLLAFTLLRNLAAVLVVTHAAACSMYFLARLHQFDDHTWLGPAVQNMTVLQCYVTSLYWSVVTFCTVGYGDFSPVNVSEQICGVFFMLVNIVVAAWIIGSITLLIVKGDEKTGQYRDSLSTLHQYGQMHQFDDEFQEKLKSQLRLGFHNREIADESVLKNFPSAIRRKILRRLYLQPLVKTQLMEGVRPQFVDAFLSSCTVEIFSPGEEIVERGAILSDLFLLVGGVAEITTPTSTVIPSPDEDDDEKHLNNRKLEAGDFIGEIGFFTESPQVDRVSSLTACKTLTISQSAYKLLAQDHPGSVGKILQNLLVKVENMKRELPKKLSVLRAGSVFDAEAGYGAVEIDAQEEEAERKQGELTAIKDLVEMHMSKQLDDQTTRLLFAASRGDTSTISLMCENGFIPDNCDYDNRSAMMVAAMKGNTDVVKLLLEYKANPNLTDMHGSTALLEAVKNGHEATTKLLMEHGAKLCMPESLAASVLCQAVFDGDILLLRRLLMAGIEINAADYDKRTAAHIAAAEGNIAAIRVLADNGADLTLEDRWKNTVQHEAERSNTRQLLEYLKHKQT